MQADPGFIGPLPYNPLWTWAGAALVLLVAAWYVFVLAGTRRPRPKQASRPAPLTDLPALQTAYLQRIADVEQQDKPCPRPQRTVRQRAEEFRISLHAGAFPGVRTAP